NFRRLLLDQVELVPVRVLEHRVGGPVLLRRRGGELDTELPERGFFLLHIFRRERDTAVPGLEGVEALAQVKRDVLRLRCHRDPVTLVLSDLEAELLRVPFRRLLRVGYNQGDRGEAHHGNGIDSGRERARATASEKLSSAVA